MFDLFDFSLLISQLTVYPFDSLSSSRILLFLNFEFLLLNIFLVLSNSFCRFSFSLWIIKISKLYGLRVANPVKKPLVAKFRGKPLKHWYLLVGTYSWLGSKDFWDLFVSLTVFDFLVLQFSVHIIEEFSLFSFYSMFFYSHSLRDSGLLISFSRNRFNKLRCIKN